jgi:PD-(D/E)XK endonuclease
MSTKQKGAIAEAMVAGEAAVLGCMVYRPVAEGGRYDLIIDAGGRLLRVQCKWAALKGPIIVVSAITSRLTPRGYVRTTYDSVRSMGLRPTATHSSVASGSPSTSSPVEASSTSG